MSPFSYKFSIPEFIIPEKSGTASWYIVYLWFERVNMAL